MTSPESWLRRRSADQGDRIALATDTRRFSFKALNDRVDEMAQALLAAGATPGRVLGSVTADTDRLALLALAAPRAGCPFLPINPRLAPSQIDAIFAGAGVTVAICDESVPAEVVAHPIPLSALGRSMPPEGGLSSAPEAIHLIIATSGSTGTPKGAMLTGSNLAAAVRASRQRVALEPGDVWLGCLPLHHIGGLSVLFRCLEAGATMRLHRRFDAAAVAADLGSGQASHISLVPAMLNQLLDQGCVPSGRLHTVLIGGAGLPAALAGRALAAGWPICPSYGMSEAASQVATCVDASRWRPGIAGAPLPGVEIGTAPSGRIRVRGPSVMIGYVNPGLVPGDGLDFEGWFETNDLGSFDADGQLQVLGRADDLLISGGENIHPIDVEGLAGHCPGVRAIGVTGKPDPVWGDLLVAVVVGVVEEPVFLDWCRQHLPSHQRPRAMLKVDALPMTVGGKLDRRALREMAASAR